MLPGLSWPVYGVGVRNLSIPFVNVLSPRNSLTAVDGFSIVGVDLGLAPVRRFSSPRSPRTPYAP